LCLLSTSGSNYNFGEHITTNDATPSEYEEMDNIVDELIDQVPIVDGITLTNVTDIDKQFEQEAQEQYPKIMQEAYNPATDPEIEHNNGQTKKRLSGKRFDKEHIKQLVSQCDLFGLSRNEGCAFINRVLNPDEDDDIPKFTPTMYATWLGKLKEHKILFFEFYSRTGIFEDVYDTRATLKMVYQNLARQFRMEIIKGKDKDKKYIVQLSQAIDMMSDTMMRVSMSSPFIAGFKSLMDHKNQIIDEIKRKHPKLLEELDIKSLSTTVPIPTEARSSPNGQSSNAEGHDKGSILERLATQEERARDGEGDIPEPSITRGIPQTDRTTGNRITERTFG
jgi:hypothetical protein